MGTEDDILDELKIICAPVIDMSGRKNMKISGGNNMATTWHSYMVSYIYGKFQFGSLVIKEEFDTYNRSAEDIAEFHNRITNEISEYQGERVVILNIVRFN